MKHAKILFLALMAVSLLLLNACDFGKKAPESDEASDSRTYHAVPPVGNSSDAVSGATLYRGSSHTEDDPYSGNDNSGNSGTSTGGDTGEPDGSGTGSNDTSASDDTGEPDGSGTDSSDNVASVDTGSIDLPIISVQDLQS